MAIDANAYKQYYGSRVAANSPVRTQLGGVWDSGIARSMEQRAARLSQPISQADIDAALSGFRPAGGGTGVTRSPLAGVNFGGSMRQQPGTPEPSGPGVFDQIRQSYGALTDELMRMRDDYARQIGESTGSTARFLEMVDPTAAYRVTAPSLQASPAAATSYLQAIGANPAQVEAQRDFANQMMASQMADQTGYQRAVDTTNQAYRQAQLAELYRNQAEAQAGLNAATMGQRAQIGMAQLQQENAIRNALLEYQLALLQAQAQRGGARNPQLPFRNIGNINF